MGFGLFKPKNKILGDDIAGRVEAVGKNVEQFQPDDEVFGFCTGAFAEYVCTTQDWLAPKPANITFEQAAAVPSSAVATLQGLRDQGQLQPGQKVLINGASGGVGTFAVQIAKSLGAEVTGVCSAKNADTARSIGADHIVEHWQTADAPSRLEEPTYSSEEGTAAGSEASPASSRPERCLRS